MPHSYTEVYVHFVWSTWHQQPLITPDVESQLHATITAKCRELGTDVYQVGGTADHIHVLLRLPPLL